MPKVGKYELGKTLGTGSFSKVKYATDSDNGTVYAMKIVSKQLIKEQQLETQLRKEISIMKMLKHQNLIELVEVLQTKSNIYMVPLFHFSHKKGFGTCHGRRIIW
jgi:serine/threonine protein kinase